MTYKKQIMYILKKDEKLNEKKIRHSKGFKLYKFNTWD